MTLKKYINLNDYTLLKDAAHEEINFYPEAAILKQKVETIKDTLHVRFSFVRDETPALYTMYVSLINSDNEEMYKSYSIYLKEISLYKYIILNSINDFKDAEILPQLIIDFNKLDYNGFLYILSNNAELGKMVPSLKSSLEKDIKELTEAKDIARVLNVQSPLNYYQNVTGYLINEIESLIANDEEASIQKSILKGFKKNYELAVEDPRQLRLSYISVYAGLLNQIKSSALSPKKILDSKELKCDTNKEEILYKDLNRILDSIVESEKNNKPIPSDLNIIQERIVYLIETKPRIKSFNKLVKIILAADEYISDNQRNRTIDEYQLKELLIKDLNSLSYRLLPRNQILVFNRKNESVDFVAILSEDMILDLLETYHINRNAEANYQALYKKVLEVLNSKEITKDEKYLELLIINIIKTCVYYYRNISDSILLFNKGDSVIKLDYKEGDIEISIVDRDTEKKQASITKFTSETKEKIKEMLDKSEKSFISYMNKYIFDNLYISLRNLALEITINELTHQGIKVKINKARSNDVFYGEFTLESLLKILSQIKELRQKTIEEIEEKEEEISLEETPVEEPEEEGLSVEEQNSILRKASAIAEEMNNRPIDNDTYKAIAEIYNEYRKTKNADLIPTMKEILEKK